MNILIFPPVFPRSSPCPHQSDLSYFSPSTNVLFLVRLNVSRLDVRLSNVTTFPSRKQAQRFKVCPTAQLRDSILGSSSLQTGLTDESGQAARTGAGHCEGHRDICEELCPRKGRGLYHSLLLSDVWFCEHQKCADCWRHRQQNCWHRWPSRGL